PAPGAPQHPLAPGAGRGRTHHAARRRRTGAGAAAARRGRAGGARTDRTAGGAVAVNALQGSLEETPLSAVLRPLVRAGKTGHLRCVRGRVTKTIYLSEGRLIFATSNHPDDRLGEMLL